MKSREDVEARIRLLLSEELEHRWAGLGERLPVRCAHNYQHPLDTRRTVGGDPNPHYNRVSAQPGVSSGQTIGLCMLGSESPEDWPGTICEDAIDAAKCPYFCPRRTKAEILTEFEEQIRDPEWVRASLPEVRALLWVLEDYPADSRPPWWRRLFWFVSQRVSTKVEPCVTTVDATHFLPSHEEPSDGVHGS